MPVCVSSNGSLVSAVPVEPYWALMLVPTEPKFTAACSPATDWLESIANAAPSVEKM